VVVGLVAALVVGGIGWLIWSLDVQQRQTSQHLRETEAALADKGQTLALLEEERRRLSDAYDGLKERWAKTDQELQQVTQEATQTSAELAARSREHTELQRNLEEARKKRDALQAHVQALEQNLTAAAAEQASLESQLQAAQSRALTPAEMEQVAQAIAKRQEEERLLRDRLAMLSEAYEQTVRQRSEPPQPSAAEASPPVASSSLQALAPPPRADPGQLAARFRKLGESYVAIEDYPKAAETFERSLVLRDDPAVHARLAFLYGRMLHDPQKAQLHASLARFHPPTAGTIGAPASAHGLPRKGWRLVWDWLTQ